MAATVSRAGMSAARDGTSDPTPTVSVLPWPWPMDCSAGAAWGRHTVVVGVGRGGGGPRADRVGAASTQVPHGARRPGPVTLSGLAGALMAQSVAQLGNADHVADEAALHARAAAVAARAAGDGRFIGGDYAGVPVSASQIADAIPARAVSGRARPVRQYLRFPKLSQLVHAGVRRHRRRCSGPRAGVSSEVSEPPTWSPELPRTSRRWRRCRGFRQYRRSPDRGVPEPLESLSPSPEPPPMARRLVHAGVQCRAVVGAGR